jgi:hypothetical protein
MSPQTPPLPGAGKRSDLRGHEHHAGGLTCLFPGAGKKLAHRRYDGGSTPNERRGTRYRVPLTPHCQCEAGSCTSPHVAGLCSSHRG